MAGRAWPWLCPVLTGGGSAPFLTNSRLLLRPAGAWETFPVSLLHLPEHQPHQVWVETGPQNTRGWVGQAVAVLVWGLLQELRYLWLQSVWLWARCLVSTCGQIRKKSQAKAPSGTTVRPEAGPCPLHALGPRILGLPVLLPGRPAQAGSLPPLLSFLSTLDSCCPTGCSTPKKAPRLPVSTE